MRRSLLLLALVACGDRNAAPQPNASVPTRPAGDGADAGVPQPIVTAPHSGQIVTVAVSDRGDVALSADENGELRFWPALDGTREPIVVRARRPVEIALAREHDGHVAALLDSAKGIELVRIAKDGAVSGRHVVPAEPGYEELAAGTTVVLARRTDHAIVRLDANAKVSRRLAPEPGEQILAIAARRGTAVAAIADRERPAEIRYVREIQIAGELAWGRLRELPEPLAAPIAVSPSGTRIAGVHARSGAAVVIELVPQPRVVGTDIPGADSDDHTIGFLDDEHAVFRGGVVLTVPGQAATVDPWSGTRSTTRVRLGEGAVVADGIVVGGLGTHLVLADTRAESFLGYRDLGVGFLRVTGTRITLGFGTRVLWLDDKLARVRAHDVQNDAAGGIALDDTHLLKATYTYLEDDRSKLDISIYDAVAGNEVPLGSWPQGSTLTYDPETSVLAVSGYTSTIARAHLDVAKNTVKALRELDARAEAIVELLDPKRADGAVAVAYSLAGNGIVIETFVDDGKRLRPLAPASSVKISDVFSALGVDRTGTMYTLGIGGDTEPKPVYAHKAGKQVKRIMVDGAMAGGTVDAAGTAIAGFSNTHIFVYDLDGKERWRVPAWSVNMAKFSADGRMLFVNTQGGLLALDGATGERRATGCAWGFGRSTLEPQLTVFLAPVVCAEAR